MPEPGPEPNEESKDQLPELEELEDNVEDELEDELEDEFDDELEDELLVPAELEELCVPFKDIPVCVKDQCPSKGHARTQVVYRHQFLFESLLSLVWRAYSLF